MQKSRCSCRVCMHPELILCEKLPGATMRRCWNVLDHCGRSAKYGPSMCALHLKLQILDSHGWWLVCHFLSHLRANVFAHGWDMHKKSTESLLKHGKVLCCRGGQTRSGIQLWKTSNVLLTLFCHLNTNSKFLAGNHLSWTDLIFVNLADNLRSPKSP